MNSPTRRPGEHAVQSGSTDVVVHSVAPPRRFDTPVSVASSSGSGDPAAAANAADAAALQEWGRGGGGGGGSAVPAAATVTDSQPASAFVSGSGSDGGDGAANGSGQYQSSSDKVGLLAPPPDAWNAAYSIMVLLGCGLLMPYNTLVSAADYLKDEYPDANIIFWIPLVMNISSPPIQMVMVRYGSRFSFVRRATIWFTVEAAVTVALPLLINGLSSLSSLYITFASLFVYGFATSILTSTVYAWASMFPAVYTQAVMGGNGWAGVIASVLRLITKGAFPDDESGLRRGSFVFFMISAVTTLCCAVGFVVMTQLPFTQHYLAVHRGLTGAAPVASDNDAGPSDAPNPRAVKPLVEDTGSVNSSSSAGAAAVVISSRAGDLTEPLMADVEPDPLVDGASNGSGGPGGALNYTRLLRKLAPFISNVMGVFVTTFLVFPGVVTSITSRRAGLTDGWLVIILLTEFNAFDLLGRTCPKYFLLVGPKKLWLFCWTRAAFFPLFLLCVSPLVFSSDIWAYVFMAVFAWSNGYFASLSMMYAPGAVEPHEREATGYIMSLALNGGILIGSMIALILSKTGAIPGG